MTRIVTRSGKRPTLVREYGMHLLFAPGAVILLVGMVGSAWLMLRRRACAKAAERGGWNELVWMTACGVGAGLAMASLLARWGPLVRNPTYLLTVALCLFLLSASLAAMRADVLLSRGRIVPVVLAVVGAAVLGWGGSGVAADLILRAGANSAVSGILVLTALVIPGGAALGLAIPSAMGHVRDSEIAGPVWSTFAAAAVTGMTLSLPVSMALGLTMTIWIAAVLLGAALTAQALGWVLAHPATAVS